MTKVMVFGTFDILHPGHLFFLTEAKKLGKELVVVIARNETVSLLKHRSPQNEERTRLANIKKLKLANRARLGNLNDYLKVVDEEKPDTIAFGYDQKFFTGALARRFGKTIKIVRLPAFHPELFKTSKLIKPQFRQFVVPGALIVKNRKVLLFKRRDPRPAFNGKWEFAGGGVDKGETVEQCLKREVKEETGYLVKIIKQLPGLPTAVTNKANGDYQVFLIIFICSIQSGSLKIMDEEISDYRWCTLAESTKLDTLPLNKVIIKDNIKLLKKYLD